MATFHTCLTVGQLRVVHLHLLKSSMDPTIDLALTMVVESKDFYTNQVNNILG